MGILETAAKFRKRTITWWRTLPPDKQAELFAAIRAAPSQGISYAALRRAVSDEWGEEVTRHQFSEAVTWSRDNGPVEIGSGNSKATGTGTKGQKKYR